ncbi:MAG: NAD(P)/FAD-dependent oxidoreductase [Chloroflexi bacterium]|nr:NAD(P)/FAD-dependent oxidoreductase [Chloroflexota bacterium]
MNNYDIIIIGAGHNGLVCASYLARAGKRVLVLEAGTGDSNPQSAFPIPQSHAGLLAEEVIAELDLVGHGLEFVAGPAAVFAPQPDGRGLTLWRDVNRTAAELADFSAADGQKYPAFIAELEQMTAALRPILTQPATVATMGELFLTQPALLRVASLASHEYFNQWFESDALKGVLAAVSVTSLMQGPRSAGTGLNWLYHNQQGALASRWVRGGVGRLHQILAEVAQAHGAEIRWGAKVQAVSLQQSAVSGVVLADGTEIAAETVISSTSPRHTLFELVGAPQLPPSVVRDVRQVRYNGGVATLTLRLSGLPHFAGQTSVDQLTGHIIVAPSADSVERAFDAAKYGRFSPSPILSMTIPTLLDESLAPAGEHLLEITMQYAPYQLREGDWAAKATRAALTEAILGTLEGVAEGIRPLILGQQLLTPLDWEQQFGYTEGHPMQGDMTLDQMLGMRPIPGWSEYATPVAGLWLCGAGTHPGGGLTGLPGRLAAEAVRSER